LLRDSISRLQALILARPRTVVAAVATVVVVCVVAALGVEFRTSRKELAPEDDPDQQRLDRLVAEFSGSQALIAGVEVEPGREHDPAGLRRFADALAEALEGDENVAEVFHRVEEDWLLDNGLYLVPEPVLAEAVEMFRDREELFGGNGSVAGFRDLNRVIARQILDGLASSSSVPEPEEIEGLRRLTELIDHERRFLLDPAAVVGEVQGTSPLLLLAGVLGERPRDAYLQTDDGTMLFLLISPHEQDDSLPVLRRLMAAVRARVDDVSAGLPGYRVTFTGTPAMTVEEMTLVRRDTWKTSLVAIFGVTVLTLLVFRWKSHSLLVLLALGAGLAMALGAVAISPGYLNMLTSAFISTLIGVGVAYGIHPVSEYELEGAHTVDPMAAIRGAWHATGAAVTVAAVTTAAAFFSIQLMQFRGFAELGRVAGIGVLLCLLSMLVLLPALLVLYARWRHGHDRTPREASNSAAVDRLWVEQAAGRICRYPRTVSVLALGLTVAAGAAAWDRIGFNTNILELLPETSESVRSLQRMTVDSDLSPFFNMVVARDIGELAELQRRAADEPSIQRFDSILQFLPADPEASAETVGGLAELLDRLAVPREAAAVDRDALVASLEGLEAALDEAAESAFGAGLSDLLEPLEQARAAAEAAAGVARDAPAEREAGWQSGEQALIDWFHGVIGRMQAATRRAPPTLETLPADIRDRFVTDKGRLIGFLYPDGNPFDLEALEPYIAASRRVSATVTGYPLMFYLMSDRITSGFRRAIVVGIVIVVLILLIDFRNLRDTLLAIVPLGMGVVWMLGGMRLCGIPFNFANMVGVPLIIGVGIDNGVHVVHRIRLEGDEGMGIVLRHTGRAILISSLTTMIGFGSLALASHRGLMSLGTVLLLGVGSCLVTSTIVLPNLLVALGFLRR
jgi:hopanoid biosynthesis associated RND transporter like protein HpnN